MAQHPHESPLLARRQTISPKQQLGSHYDAVSMN